MAIPSRRQRRSSIDIWAVFVDALSQLVMVIICVLLVSTAGQFYLTDALSGRDAALQRLTQRINEITELLSLEQKTSADLRLNLSQLSSQLQAVNAERDALTTRLARADDATAKANRSAGDLEGKLAAAQQDVAQRDAKLAEAQSTVDQLNHQLLALRQQLARIAGHTDKRPITTAQFPSNWELSTARAISVVRFFIDQGIPANRLVAAGFGENQPIDARDGEDAYRRNRRIELKLTER